MAATAIAMLTLLLCLLTAQASVLFLTSSPHIQAMFLRPYWVLPRFLLCICTLMQCRSLEGHLNAQSVGRGPQLCLHHSAVLRAGCTVPTSLHP